MTAHRLDTEPDGTSLCGRVAAIDIREHTALVHWAIKRFGYAKLGRGAIDYDDLASAGHLGLIRAAELFRPELGAFSTYAVQWIRQCVRRELENMNSTVRVPVYLQEKRRREQRKVLPVVRSLDAPLRGADESDATLADVTSDPDAPASDEIADARGGAARLAELMDRARLGPRDRLVLRLRAQGVTLEEVGERLALSRERIRQLERDALTRLRRAAGVPTDAPPAHRRRGRASLKPRHHRRTSTPPSLRPALSPRT